MPAEFHFQRPALDKIAHRHAVTVVTRAAHRVHADATQRSPLDTGALRQSHRISPPTTSGKVVSMTITATQKYALAVHEGTKAHVIRPKTRTVLAWGPKTDRVFARSVNHPGTKPRPWLRNALHAQAPRLGFTVTDS